MGEQREYNQKKMFYVGQQIICFDDEFDSAWWRTHGQSITRPTAGVRYRVRGYVDPPPAYEMAGPPCLLLVEIANVAVDYVFGVRKFRAEAAFSQERFAPATDISDLCEVARDAETCAFLINGETRGWDRKRRRVV